MASIWLLFPQMAAARRKIGTLGIAFLLFSASWLSTATTLRAAEVRISQEPPVTLQEALQNGQIEASAQAIGMGFREPMIRLTVSSRVGSDIVVVVPLGTRLSSGMGQFAEIVIGEEKQVRAAPTAQVDLIAYSLQPDRSLPSAMGKVQYLVAGMANDTVQQGLRKLQANAGSDYGGQLALWAWSTGKTLDELIAMSSFPVQRTAVENAAIHLGLTPTPAATATHTASPPTAVQAGSSAASNSDLTSQPSAQVTASQATPVPPTESRLPYELILLGVALIVFVAAVLILALSLAGRRDRRTSAVQPSALPEGPTLRERQAAGAGEKKPGGSASNAAVFGGAAAPGAGQPGGRSAHAGGQLTTDDETQSVDLDETESNSEYGVELVGTAGPLAGTRYPFADRCILSRGPVQWIEMRTPEVSAPHAAIDFATNDSRIKNLRSRNGIIVGGKRLDEGFNPLPIGAEITIGANTLKLGPGSLQSIAGPLKGKSWPLSPQLWVISRDRLHVLVAQQDRRISDVHALLTPAVLGVNLRDLNSSNGSWIGDKRVSDDTWATAGDEIRVGGSCLRVEVKFGRYRLRRVLGEGGMARVYYATDASGGEIALKTPRESEAPFRERFDRESNILRSLSHKHIVPVCEIGEMSGVPFVAMKYMRGGTLFEQLQDGPLSLARTLTITTQLADALEYAYGQGLDCHRDVKPSNVLLDEQGDTYLTDFGIARRTDDKRITSFGVALGTVAYMSPEQLTSQPVDRRTDVYSLGVVMYQMLTGEVPFEGTSKTVTEQKTHQVPPSLRTVAPDVPVAVEQIVMKCLQVDPERRYRTAGELAAAIRAINEA